MLMSLCVVNAKLQTHLSIVGLVQLSAADNQLIGGKPESTSLTNPDWSCPGLAGLLRGHSPEHGAKLKNGKAREDLT